MNIAGHRVEMPSQMSFSAHGGVVSATCRGLAAVRHNEHGVQSNTRGKSFFSSARHGHCITVLIIYTEYPVYTKRRAP